MGKNSLSVIRGIDIANESMYFCSGYQSVQIIISREGRREEGVVGRAEGLGGGNREGRRENRKTIPIYLYIFVVKSEIGKDNYREIG